MRENVVFKPTQRPLKRLTALNMRREQIHLDVYHIKVIPEPRIPEGDSIWASHKSGASITKYEAIILMIVII